MKFRFFIFSLFLVMLFGAFPHGAGAVTVGPVRLEISADPGTTATGDILLLNEGKDPQTFYPSFEKFTENDLGEKIFSRDPSGLADWFQLDSGITLAPGEQRHVPYKIVLPNNAPPGGHFAVMWWGTAPANQKDGGQVSIVTRAGILVYLRVSGNIQELGEVQSFRASKKIFFSSPVSFSTEFKNSGNVALKPSGNLVVSNLFGIEKGTVPFNPNGAFVLPERTKQFETQWQFNNWYFGPYHVEAKIAYGDEKKEAQASEWIFVFGLEPLIILIGLLCGVFVLPPLVRKYNRWIVKKSHSGK